MEVGIQSLKHKKDYKNKIYICVGQEFIFNTSMLEQKTVKVLKQWTYPEPDV